jgi:hypothetical protein
MAFSEPVFTKLALAGQLVQGMYKPNFTVIPQKNCLAGDIGSQTDGRT